MLPEVGATELLVIAAIALIVVGPKDLPILLRKVGQFVARMRGMAAEFRASFDEMARQSELDELRKEVEAMRQAAQQPAHYAAERFGLGDAAAGLHAETSEISDHLADRLHPEEEAEAADPGPEPEEAAPPVVPPPDAEDQPTMTRLPRSPS